MSHLNTLRPGYIEIMALDTRVLVVAKEGHVGDWAAYIGAVRGDDHEEEAQQVAYEGSKLSRRLAEFLFPEWAKRLSWRD